MADRTPLEVADAVFTNATDKDSRLKITAREVLLFGWRSRADVQDFISENYDVTSKAFLTRRTNKLYHEALIATRGVTNETSIPNSIWKISVHHRHDQQRNFEYLQDMLGVESNLFSLFSTYDLTNILNFCSPVIVGFVSADTEENARLIALNNVGPASQSKYAIYSRECVGYDDTVNDLNRALIESINRTAQKALAIAAIAKAQAKHNSTLEYFLNSSIS